MKIIFSLSALLMLFIDMQYKAPRSNELKKQNNYSSAYIDSVLESGRIERMKSMMI